MSSRSSFKTSNKKTGVKNLDLAGAYLELRNEGIATTRAMSNSSEPAPCGDIDLDDIDAEIEAMMQATQAAPEEDLEAAEEAADEPADDAMAATADEAAATEHQVTSGSPKVAEDSSSQQPAAAAKSSKKQLLLGDKKLDKANPAGGKVCNEASTAINAHASAEDVEAASDSDDDLLPIRRMNNTAAVDAVAPEVAPLADKTNIKPATVANTATAKKRPQLAVKAKPAAAAAAAEKAPSADMPASAATAPKPAAAKEKAPAALKTKPDAAGKAADTVQQTQEVVGVEGPAAAAVVAAAVKKPTAAAPRKKLPLVKKAKPAAPEVVPTADDNGASASQPRPAAAQPAVLPKKKKKLLVAKPAASPSEAANACTSGASQKDTRNTSADATKADAAPSAPQAATAAAAAVVPKARKVLASVSKKEGAAAAGGSSKKAAKQQQAGEGAPAKVPRGRTAFMIYLASVREQIKEEDSTLRLPDISKRAGEMWGTLSGEEKRPFQDESAAERAAAKEKQSSMLQGNAGNVPAKAAKRKAPAKEGGGKRTKTSYQLFCDSNRPAIKQLHPEASSVEILTLLAEAWKDARPQEREQYEEQSRQLKEEALAAATAQQGSAAPEAEEAVPALQEKKVKKARTAAKKQRAQRAAKRGGGDLGEQEQQEDEGHDSDSESDREDVDWEAHPAEMVLAHSADGKYLVKRKGLDLTEYGKVDARAAKRQRFEGLASAAAAEADGSGAAAADEAPPACPLPLALVEEYESFTRAFWTSVHDRTSGGALDLDGLEEGSALEACYLLGKLQEPQQLLHRASTRRGEADTMIRVPALALSMVVQRLISGERQAAQQQISALSARVAELETAVAAE